MFTAVLYHLFVFTAHWKSLGTKETDRCCFERVLEVTQIARV